MYYTMQDHVFRNVKAAKIDVVAVFLIYCHYWSLSLVNIELLKALDSL